MHDKHMNIGVTILEMYISMMPVILAGILNMIWCKSDFALSLKVPMDNNIILRDGKRLFGDNKTWKGFFGMIISGIIVTTCFGAICGQSDFLSAHNYLYVNYNNTSMYNFFIGLLWGAAYVVFELPNSFIKRRMDIKPGKHVEGVKGFFSVVFDQADSLIGCVLILCIVYKMSFGFYIFYVLLGAFTHIIVNVCLYAFKLRKNRF